MLTDSSIYRGEIQSLEKTDIVEIIMSTMVVMKDARDSSESEAVIFVPKNFVRFRMERGRGQRNSW